MRQKNRNLIPTGNDPIIFSSSNNKFHEWYWDYDLDIPKKPELAISIPYSELERPDRVDIILTYIDTSKPFKPTSSFEFVETITRDIPKGVVTDKYQVVVVINPIVEKKMLWKVAFKVKTTKPKTILYLSI